MDTQPVQQFVNQPSKKAPVKFGLSIAIVIICLVATAVAVYWVKTEPNDLPSMNIIPKKPANQTESWQTYRNEEYGFEIKITDTWKGFKVTDENFSDLTNLRFWFPTTDKSPWWDNGSGFADMMVISVYTLDQWKNKSEVFVPEPGPVFLAKNSKYVFTYSFGHACPADLCDKNFEFEKVFSTFKFTNQNQIDCNTDSDCQNGASCMVTGPIITNQPVHKICVPKGQAVPL